MSDEHIEISGVASRPSSNELERRARDAEPLDDESGPQSSLALDLAEQFRGDVVSDVTAPEILLFLAERGALPAVNGRHHAEVQNADGKYKELTAILLKVLDYTRPPDRPGKDEFDVLSTMRVRRYAVLHAFDQEQFDFMNGNLNTQEFAATVKVLKLNYVKGKVRRTEKALTKAAVNNAVLDAQKHFQLPPRRDQRNEETRDKQSKVRKGQLAA